LGDDLSLVSLFASSERLLVGGIGLSLHVGDALLGAGVGVLDVARVFGGQIVEFVGLIDDGGGFFFDVVFGGATGREKDASAGEKYYKSAIGCVQHGRRAPWNPGGRKFTPHPTYHRLARHLPIDLS